MSSTANTSTSLSKRTTHEVNIATTLQQQAAAQKVAKMGVNNPVLLPDEVDTTIMEFATRMGRDGQKKVYLNYGTRRLMVETPWMGSYRGIEDTSAAFGETTGPPKYQIRCGIRDHDMPGSEAAAFVAMLQRMEAKVTEAAILNSQEWFKKRNLSKEVVTEAMLQKMIRFSVDAQTGEPDGRWPPEFRMKLQCYDGDWKCVAYDGSDAAKPVKVEDDLAKVVTGRVEVKGIVECSQVWVLNGKLGCTWNVRQLLFRPQVAGGSLSPTTYAFDTGKAKALNATSVQVAEMKVVNEDTGFKRAYLNDANGGPLLVQTPWLKSPGGIREPPEEYAQAGKTKFNLSFVLDGFRGENPETAAFFNELEALDDHLIEACVANCQPWFGKKKLTHEVLKQAMFQPSVPVKTKDDGQENVWFKVDVPCYDGEWKCAAYPQVDDAVDRECQTDDLDNYVTGKVMARAILQCKGLWSAGGRIGCNWKVVQLEYQADTGGAPSGYAFRGAEHGLLPVELEGEAPVTEEPMEEDDVVVDEEEEDYVDSEED